jgi:hypothetical protein
MTDPLSLSGTLAALALPWLSGCAFLARLLKTSPRRNWQIIMGHGYFVGLLLTTLVIRAWDLVGLKLHFWGIAAAVAVMAAAIHHSGRYHSAVPVVRQGGPTSSNWQRIAFWLLVALITYRYWGLAQEIWLRPLYAWDAWMNWAPKAVVWYEFQELVPFTSPADWLKLTGGELVYTTGAQNAWKYPVTVPLIQLWGMLAAGTSDQNLSNLPWLLAPLAFALALYGHLKLLGASALLGAIACYVLLSVPYINVHSALAGYADLWLALAFGAAVLALHEWRHSQHWPWGVLSLFFAFACTQIKLPGLVLGAIILTVFLMSLMKFGARTWLAIAAAATCCLLYVAFIGVSLDIPTVGRIELGVNKVSVPYLGTFELAYRPVHQALTQTIFSMLNWNILWYLFSGLLIIKLLQKQFLNPPSMELQCLFFLLLFLFFIFYFTHISAFVLDYSTVNRVLLYAVPTMIFYIFKSVHFGGLVTLTRRLNCHPDSK